MSIEDFNRFSDQHKKELLIDARKVAEREDDIATYELFQINNFFIEVSRSVTRRFRKILNTYSWKEIPLIYSAQVYSNLAK